MTASNILVIIPICGNKQEKNAVAMEYCRAGGASHTGQCSESFSHSSCQMMQTVVIFCLLLDTKVNSSFSICAMFVNFLVSADITIPSVFGIFDDSSICAW